MQLNKWYTLKDSNSFISYAPTLNKAIVSYLDGRPFQVVEFDEEDSDGIKGIRFEDSTTTLYRNTALPEFNEREWSNGWFYEDEYEFFDEVDPPKTEESEEKDADSDYGCLVSNPNELGFLIRAKDATLEEAEKFAEQWLVRNEGDEVIVFKGISRFNVVKEPKVVKKQF